MYGLFSRPSRRMRFAPRCSTRPTLRVEALETRANPAGPVFSNLAVTWSDATHVVVTGQVIDQNPTAVWVNGGGQGAAFINAQGTFRIALTTDGTDPINVQAQDTQNQFSTDMVCQFGSNPVAATNGQQAVSGVTISNENGVWHIKGQVTSGTPLDTLIKIISDNSNLNGQQQVVENPDGSFDIAISANGEDIGGGNIGISLINSVTGETSGVIWEGTIDD
jgi:hypothetical protein